MDVIELLKSVTSLNDYKSISHEMMKNLSSIKLPCNIMSIVPILKKIQSFEIEYLINENESGAVIMIIELILRLPSSKAWSIFGEQLVNLIQGWLYNVKKRLIGKIAHWWPFMSILLRFMKKLYLKEKSLIPLIVEKTGEMLLDIATMNEISMEQQYQILQCFNKYSELVRRDLRSVLRKKFEIYFTLLAASLPTCGDVCVQYALLETLLRWLVARHDERVRREAAARWFPSPLCRAADVFAQRTWQRFAEDARSFLNVLNESNDAVVSVLCQKLYIGNVAHGQGQAHWLDVNCGSSSVSLMLDKELTKELQVARPASASDSTALVVTHDNTESAHLCTGSRSPHLSLKVIDPLKMYGSDLLKNKHVFQVIITSQCNLQKLDKAMKFIFNDKYQLLEDTEPCLEMSQTLERTTSKPRRFVDYISEEETKFSNPPEILRKKILEQKVLSSRQSTASVTSSLALARDTLNAFADCNFLEETQQSDKVVINNDQSKLSSEKFTEVKSNLERKDENPAEIYPTNISIEDANIIDLLAEEALESSLGVTSKNDPNNNPTIAYSATDEIVENVYINNVCDFNKNTEHSNQNSDMIESDLRRIPLQEVTNREEGKTVVQKTKNIQVPGITLKYPNTKKQIEPLKKKHKFNLKLTRKMSSITERETDQTKTVSGAKKLMTEIPSKNPTHDPFHAPSSRRKRKLYSLKDDVIINAKIGIHVSETEEENSNLTACNNVSKVPTSSATSYKELEKIRKKAKTQQLRNQKTNNKISKADNTFDLLKQTVHNEVTLIDRKLFASGDVYNFTSSEDEEFKKTKAKSKKNTIHYSPKPIRKYCKKPKNNSNDDHSRVIGTFTRSKANRNIDTNLTTPKLARELVDERMRVANTELLNTSLVVEAEKEQLNVEAEPVHKKPKMELIPGDQEYEIAMNPKEPAKKQYKNKNRSKKKNANKLIINDKCDDSKTISPLPLLEIEMVPKRSDPENSSRVLEKLANNYRDNIAVLDDTQNLLDDLGPVDNRRPTVNITKDLTKAPANTRKRRGTIHQIGNDSPIVSKRATNSRRSSDESGNNSYKLQVVVDKIDIHSHESLLTGGDVPITAHGVLGESPPPEMEEIYKSVTPRTLETECYNEHVMEYFNKLTNDINLLTSCRSTSNGDKSDTVPKTPQKVPIVIVQRLTKSEIDSYLNPNRVRDRTPFASMTKLSQLENDTYLARRNLVFYSSSISKSDGSAPENPKNSKNTKKPRKSAISPINLKEFGIIQDTSSTTYVVEDRSESVKHQTPEQEQSQYVTNRYNTRRYRAYCAKTKSSVIGSGDTDKDLTRAKVGNKNTSGVQLSGSSIEDWFTKNERNKQRCTVKDVVSNIIEKMDTSLNEIHQATSTSLIKMLAEMRGRLEAARAAHRRRAADAADALLRSFVAAFAAKFDELDAGFKKDDEDIIRYFEQRTREINAKDAKMKRVFMNLMKEDMRPFVTNPAGDDGDDDDD